jgi:hypothetical protein
LSGGWVQESICKPPFLRKPQGIIGMRWWGEPAIAIAVATSFALMGIIPAAKAAEGLTVGMVTKVVSPAQVGAAPAVVGTLVHMNDQLRTGAKARLQVTFRDKTELTLGENATVVIDRYVFDPNASTGELVLKTGVAAFRLATGKISELRNKNIVVSTPVAALAVRGTDFWWGPIEGVFGVLLVSNSKLDVKNDAGEVLIDKAGYGTDIEQGLSKKKAPGGPGRPYKWPPEKVAEALSQTSFGPGVPGFPPGILIPPVFIIPPLVTPPSAHP